MSERFRQLSVVQLFFLMTVWILSSCFIYGVLWRDNNGMIASRDVSIMWLSDADFRGIQTSSTPYYRLSDGRSLRGWSNPQDREKFLALFDLATPDGKWHGWITTKGTGLWIRSWLTTALPILAMSIVGLVLSLSGLIRPSRGKKEPATTSWE